MKQKVEFKVTGIAIIKGLKLPTKRTTPKPGKTFINDNGEEYAFVAHPTHRSPHGANNKVSVLISGPTKNRLEKLRKYIELQTGDVPCYSEAASWAINELCNQLGI